MKDSKAAACLNDEEWIAVEECSVHNVKVLECSWWQELYLVVVETEGVDGHRHIPLRRSGLQSSYSVVREV